MDMLAHLKPHALVHLHIGSIDMSISGHVLWMWISSCVIFFLFMFGIKRGGGLIPKGIYNLLEGLIVFINEQLVIPNFGKEEGKKWFPFISTLFLFILFNNLLGLIPGSSTATSNINVTGTLALMVFFCVQGIGIKKHGFFTYVKSWVPGGVPIFIAIPMFPLEFIGQLAKPFSLAIRLFANMFAGHAVLLVFLNLILMSKAYFVWIFPLSGSLLVTVLEVGFSAIQAFIFTILSSMYIGEAIHPSH